MQRVKESAEHASSRGSSARGIACPPTAEEIKDMCSKIMSHRTEDYTYALDRYCAPDCRLDNDDLWLTGVNRIKKVIDFTTAICKDSGVIGKPLWDQQSRTATYQYFRYLKFGKRIDQTTVLHFEQVPGSDRSSPRLWVSVIGDKHVNMPWTRWPIIGHIHLYVLRPLFSYMILGFAALSSLRFRNR